MLRKDPGLTAATVLPLALGIAANTAVFTFYNAVALRPIQARDPGRMVNVYRSTGTEQYGLTFSHPDYLHLRDHNTRFSDLIATGGTQLALSGGEATIGPAAKGGIVGLAGIRFFHQLTGSAEIVAGALVSDNYFSTLGIPPALGRTFLPEEYRGAYPAAMLSFNFWQRRFNADASIVGKTLTLNGTPFTVVGITVRDFLGTYQSVRDVWLPLGAFRYVEAGRDPLDDGEHGCCRVFGRLDPMASREDAAAELTVLADGLRRTHPPSSDFSRPVTITVTPGSPFGFQSSPEVMGGVGVVLGAVGLVLAIACANVAGLQLARAMARQREITVRLALGASRGRVVRQLLTEAALLALLAGGVGLMAAWWAVRILVTAISSSLPAVWGTLALQVDPDLRVFAYTVAISLGAGVLFGLTPAVEGSKLDLHAGLKRGDAGLGASSRWRARDVLVAGEVALCATLLIGAGLLVRGSARALEIEPGFETKRVLGMGIDMPPGLGYDPGRSAATVRELAARFRTVPGVRAVARGRIPLAGNLRQASVLASGPAGGSRALPPSYYSYVSPEYFEVLGIPIVRGRAFTEPEGAAAAVTIVSAAAARALWPGEDPLGKHLALDASTRFHDAEGLYPAGQSLEVVGVAADLRSVWLDHVDPAYFYLPMPRDRYYDTVVVRVENDPSLVMEALGREVKAVDPSIVVYAQTVEGLVTNNPAFVFSRIGAILSSAIGLLGLLLAAVGIHGVVSHGVMRRTREVGIRMALGAQGTNVVALVMREGMTPVGWGLLGGLAAAAGLSHVLERFLFGLRSLDPVSFAGGAAFLCGVALLASYLPARRALRVDPIAALRHE
jgi:putative ABC transport system permease protein